MSTLPAAPPGLPPTLVVAKAIPAARRAGAALACTALYAALAGFAMWRGLSPTLAVAILLPFYAVTLVTTFGATLCAGNGWLGNARRYVRTDQLVDLRTRTNLSGMRVSMRDREGRSLFVRFSDLTIDSRLWELVRGGVAASLAAGLETDARSRDLFA